MKHSPEAAPNITIAIPPPVRAIMLSLNKLAPVRVVGGAVRDQLLARLATSTPATPQANVTGEQSMQQLTAQHYDLAIKTTPDELKKHAEQFADWRLVLDGFAHGIIRIITQGIMVEVACLRRDVTTDGRHATVAFGGDWPEDAARRDFTINALYADAAGVVSDPLNIIGDFSPLTLRFIGSAEKRIAEDYLRILRYYRFLATLPDAAFNHDGRKIIMQQRAGLAKISRERVGMELLKILSSRKSPAIITMMQADDIWQVLNISPDMSLIKKITSDILPDSEKNTAQLIDAWPSHRRAAFYALMLEDIENNVTNIQKNFSSFAWPREVNQLLATYRSADKTLDGFAFHYYHGGDAYHLFLLCQLLADKITSAQYRELSTMPQPVFPLAKAGDELLARGFTAKDFSAVMPRLEKKWLASHGALTKDDLLKDVFGETHAKITK
ncbi:MAG: hypothetical protein QM529_06295 [Hydrotalea sp.]|nr:hypothetical protein [Hydrotalea sp.]